MCSYYSADFNVFMRTAEKEQLTSPNNLKQQQQQQQQNPKQKTNKQTNSQNIFKICICLKAYLCRLKTGRKLNTLTLALLVSC